MLTFASASTVISATGTIDKGGFTHLVATYNRGPGENRLYLYANEELIATSSTQVEMGDIDFTLSSMNLVPFAALPCSSTGR